jgi:hypothetical protein
MYTAMDIGVVPAVKAPYRFDHGQWSLGGRRGVQIHQGLAVYLPGQYGEIFAYFFHIQGRGRWDG